MTSPPVNEPNLQPIFSIRLRFSATIGVRLMNEMFPLERAADVYECMMSGHALFRVVLTTGG